MVKAPTTRHGKSGRQSKVLDLEAVRVEDPAKVAEPYEGSPSGSATVLSDENSPKAGHDAAMISDEPEVFEAEPAQTKPEGEGAEPVSGDAVSGPAESDLRAGTPLHEQSSEPRPEGFREDGSRSGVGSTSTQATSSASPIPAAHDASRDRTRSGAGIGALLAAALIGGAVAVGVTYFLGQAGLLTDNRETVDPAAFAQLQTEVETLRNQDMSGDAEAQVQALRESLDSLGQQVSALEARPQPQPVDLGPIEGRMQALQQRVDAMGQRVEEQANDPRLALALSASALKSAIDRGDPFATELEAYSAAVEDKAAIAPLQPLAASGVPTRTTILSELPAAVAAMTDAARPVDESASMLSRLWSSATELVDVRPVGANVEGSAPEAIVARLEAAIRADDYAGAVREFDTLPPAVKTAGEPLMAKVRARQAADTLIDDALGQALNPT